jgi:hypothetical protein
MAGLDMLFCSGKSRKIVGRTESKGVFGFELRATSYELEIRLLGWDGAWVEKQISPLRDSR